MNQMSCIFHFGKTATLQRYTHQEAVKEFMHTESQHADKDIGNVVEEGHIHDDCSVSTSKCASIPNKAHQKYNLVTKLGEWTKIAMLQSSEPYLFRISHQENI